MTPARQMVEELVSVVPADAHLDNEDVAEDVWDVRCIPGVRYDPHRSNYTLNFTSIPVPYRTAVKQYIKLRLFQCSHASGRQHLQYLPHFFAFHQGRSPHVQHFQDLCADDMTAYHSYLRTKRNRKGQPLSTQWMWLAFHTLDSFLRYLQRIDSPLAPTRPIDKLIWPEHRGRQPKTAAHAAKYIPELVLAQLDLHIHRLRPRYIPVIVLLRASGWRISDILQLRHDTCLEHTARGWYLVGDIHKTEVMGHKVPITDEVAAIVQAQALDAQQRLANELDGKRYLFPTYSARRRGQPLAAHTVLGALNRLAETCHIRDAQGNIFHFRSHAFRHTKAVELINNGMPLHYVQQWLAHASPEMTLVYAKLLDTTMRDKWEQAMARGAVRINDGGQPYHVDPDTLDQGNELELEHVRAHLDARRLQNGYCFKHQKFDCPAAHVPCYGCSMFVTTPEFLPHFQQEQCDTIELIEIGEAAGRTHWADANRRKLDKLEQIINTLEQGTLHQPMSKATREYTPKERAAQAALDQQGSEQ